MTKTNTLPKNLGSIQREWEQKKTRRKMINNKQKERKKLKRWRSKSTSKHVRAPTRTWTQFLMIQNIYRSRSKVVASWFFVPVSGRRRRRTSNRWRNEKDGVKGRRMVTICFCAADELGQLRWTLYWAPASAAGYPVIWRQLLTSSSSSASSSLQAEGCLRSFRGGGERRDPFLPRSCPLKMKWNKIKT